MQIKTIHLLERPKSRTPPSPNVDVDMEQCELSYPLLVGMESDKAITAHSLVVYYKTEHTLPVQSSNCAPLNLPKKDKYLCPHKSLINLEATKVFFSR
jgi:hypothetical protein